MTAEVRAYPLEGLRVLDFSRVLAGPFAGRMLADLGADVVKIEPPEGDSTRLWGKVIGGIGGYFTYANAGKRSMCVDLHATGAQELVIAMARAADVVIENFRPDVMDRLGVGYEVLSAANPRLIMLSISGFGRAGPESHRPAYAPIVHAETGLIERSARRSGLKQDAPLSVADTNAGLHGLVALLSALLMRERTGMGQHIDIAMIDAMIVTDDQLQVELDDAEETRNLPPDIWETGVGAILVSADFRYVWRLLVEGGHVVDPSRPGMELSEKIAARRAAVETFMGSLASWEQVEAAMATMNLAWGRVRSGTSLREQPTVAARRAIAQIDDRAGGSRPVPQSPYKFSSARAGVRGAAPFRGEHNAEVLREWIQIGEGDLEALYANGVIARESTGQT